MKIGLHVSISGSLAKSVDNASVLGCTAFQIFTRSPRQWKTKDISDEEASAFKYKLNKSKIESGSVVVHMPYLPNLSAPSSDLYKKSMDVLTDEIKRCNLLNLSFLVIHLGSHLGKGSKQGISQLVDACNASMDNYKNAHSGKNGVTILLENSAGQKNSIGSKMEEIAEIFDKLNKPHFGLCLDTCHAFAAGYDLSKEDGVTNLIDNISTTIGIDKLKVIHLNDSKGSLGSNLDRHYHIGLGKIGKTGLKFLLNNKQVNNIPFIMETPIDDVRNDTGNINYVLSLLN
ncbi:MAG: deoxyribonuclease IV [Thermoproteota archaeon]|nr:deoxyribonuclease IV [Thermoproteota archaeon]